MIPNIENLETPLSEATHGSETYRVVLVKDPAQAHDVYYDRIKGFTDGINAVKQAIYFILGTERYEYLIYSWDYGIQLADLYGKPMPFVKSELPRRIKEALVTDNRITDVIDFTFKNNGKKLGVSFTVVSNVGNIDSELEVMV